MAKFQINKNTGYTVISNHCFRNKNLSAKAWGLLCFMVSVPDNWDYSERGLAACMKDGRDSIRAGLKELEDEGYLVRTRERNADGTLGETIYDLCQNPTDKSPVSLSQNNSKDKAMHSSNQHKKSTNEPKLDYPKLENPTLDNTPNKINKELNTKNNSLFLNNNLSIKDITSKIKDQINYTTLLEYEDVDKGVLNNIVECIITLNANCHNQPSIKIGENIYPSEVVLYKLNELTIHHIKYVMDCLNHTKVKIKNIKSYLQVSIINSIDTIDSYYLAEVNHDLKYNAFTHKNE